jgi:multiple sugar transport system ATP-binding protein
MEDAALARDVPQDRRIQATVLLTEALGSEVVVQFGVDVEEVVTADTKQLAKDRGTDQVSAAKVGAAAHHQAHWVASFGPRSRVRPGDTVEVAIDTRRLHFFDPETSLSIRE